jgi:D-alanyl-D-alanine carboxypeptidase/D-alanyl-D-alanine-endopeptidase (penicillin-binding protein 4)
MEDIFNDPNFSNANWGVLIQSLETGEYFYKRNEDKLFIPASNLKLFTTSAGLFLLGADYRFSTNVYMKGYIDGSVLKGDLVIQGRGDPTISSRFYNNDMYRVYSAWADSLLELGIDEITGNIIGDDNLFDDKNLGEGWAWDYESYWYSAPSGAVSFNDNTVDIIITFDNETQKAKISILPDSRYIIVKNNITVVPQDSLTSIDVYRERGTNFVSVHGTLKINSDTIKTFVTVNNPTQYSMVVLSEVLKRRGITIGGFPMDVDDIAKPLEYSGMQKLFSFNSPQLKEIIKVVNKNSQNFYAEQLLKTIGLETYNYGSIENGVKAAERVFQEMGINTENMIIVDGSGLSRLNLITPRHIISLLSYMYKSKYFISFFNSLPIAGVDGTLGMRMKNTKAENKVRAKTGYLEAVRSLSGYAFTGDNEPVVFSILVNNFNVPVKLAENLQDLVCLRLVNFKRK